MAEEIEVMQVIRQMPSGKLVVQAGLHRVYKLDDVSNDMVRQRILVAIGELIEFAGGYRSLVKSGVAPELVLEPDTLSQEQREENFLRSLHTVAPAPVTDTGMLSVTPEAVTGSEPSRTSVDIAAQINEIIQRLQKGPYHHLSHHQIELRSDGGSRMLIEVDGELYDNPDQVEDGDIRLLLKMALREWDRR